MYYDKVGDGTDDAKTDWAQELCQMPKLVEAFEKKNKPVNAVIVSHNPRFLKMYITGMPIRPKNISTPIPIDALVVPRQTGSS